MKKNSRKYCRMKKLAVSIWSRVVGLFRLPFLHSKPTEEEALEILELTKLDLARARAIQIMGMTRFCADQLNVSPEQLSLVRMLSSDSTPNTRKLKAVITPEYLADVYCVIEQSLNEDDETKGEKELLLECKKNLSKLIAGNRSVKTYSALTSNIINAFIRYITNRE